MKQLIGAVLAVSLLVPGAAFAAEAVGVVQAWGSGKRVLTLRTGLSAPYSQIGCAVDAAINVPNSLSAGRNVTIQYTGAGAGQPGDPPNIYNKCNQLSLN